MSITKIAEMLLFRSRQRELDRYNYDAERMQHEVLEYLINKGSETEYGRKHMFST